MNTAEQIGLVFGTEAYLRLSYTVLEGNSGISKSTGSFLENFYSNSGLRKFRNCTPIVSGDVNLSRWSVW